VKEDIDITDEEERMIEVLIGHAKTGNAYGEPIDAVGRAMKWTEATTLEVVKDLERRNIIVRRMDPFKALEAGEGMPKLKSWWERVNI
jgi:hypothetical protein